MSGTARHAYDVLASRYDELTAANDYENWFSLLLPELERRGLRQGRALDVGCGTGRAFEPLLRRGWEVCGVDLSPRMLARARSKFGGRVRLAEGNARELPVLGEFELVISLNDVLGYSTEDGDLERIFAGMRDNLAAGGRICFDLGTLFLFRANLSGAGDSEWLGNPNLRWRGLGGAGEAGSVFESEVFGEGLETHIHRERHWRREDVLEALAACGLECLGEIGHNEVEGKGIVFTEPPDEERDHRVIYIAGRS
ncbi:MAG: class I SAM-dependent methyltransferase [Solirubrobacterales bacterium]